MYWVVMFLMKTALAARSVLTSVEVAGVVRGAITMARRVSFTSHLFSQFILMNRC